MLRTQFSGYLLVRKDVARRRPEVQAELERTASGRTDEDRRPVIAWHYADDNREAQTAMAARLIESGESFVSTSHDPMVLYLDAGRESARDTLGVLLNHEA